MLDKYVADVSRVKNHPDDIVKGLVLDIEAIFCYTDKIFDVNVAWSRVIDIVQSQFSLCWCWSHVCV